MFLPFFLLRQTSKAHVYTLSVKTETTGGRRDLGRLHHSVCIGHPPSQGRMLGAGPGSCVRPAQLRNGREKGVLHLPEILLAPGIPFWLNTED